VSNYNSKKNILPLRINEISKNDRPREKIKKAGIARLSDIELIALIIGSGNRRTGVFEIAEEILHIIDHKSAEDYYRVFKKVRGIGDAKATALCAAFELTRRKLQPSNNKIKKPEDLYPWLKDYSEKKQEHFITITLNGANEIVARRVITIGLLNSSQIHPREVFADAITDRAASIILAHNHPSGNLVPSVEDIAVTEKLVSSGILLGIPVLDHIIVSGLKFFSFKEEGLIK